MTLYLDKQTSNVLRNYTKAMIFFFVSLCFTCIYVSLAEFQLDILYWKYIYQKHKCSTCKTNNIDAAIN